MALQARRKLKRILRSHSLSFTDFRGGDFAQVYTYRGHEKQGKWLSPRRVISTDPDYDMLTVSGVGGHVINVRRQIALAVHVTSNITDLIQQAFYHLDETIDAILSSSPTEMRCEPA